MIQETILSDLRHDAECAREIGSTIVCRVNCCVLLELIAEIENHRLTSLVFERKQIHPAARD